MVHTVEEKSSMGGSMTAFRAWLRIFHRGCVLANPFQKEKPSLLAPPFVPGKNTRTPIASGQRGL